MRLIQRTALAAAMAIFGLSPAAAQEKEDPVVGRVNGVEIHQSQIARAYQGLPEQYKQLPIEALHKLLLDREIDDVLVGAKAKELDYANDPEVQERLAAAQARVYREVFFTRIVSGQVTEEAMQGRYEELIAAAPSEMEVRARHILLETEDEAKAVIVDANKDGADFAELARTRSKGPSAPQGGDLGYFTKGMMVSEFADAAFGLGVGEISAEPVQTQFGWHVIKVEDKRESAPPSFEEMREQIFENMSQEAIAQGIVELRRGAEIERFEFDGSPLVESDGGGEDGDSESEEGGAQEEGAPAQKSE